MAVLTTQGPVRLFRPVGIGLSGFLRASDCVVGLTAGLLSHLAFHEEIFDRWPQWDWPDLLILLLGILLMSHVYELFHLYGPRPLIGTRDATVLQAHLVVAVCIGISAFILGVEQAPLRPTSPNPAWWILAWQALTLAGVLYSRRALRLFFRVRAGTAGLARNVIVVGAPAFAEKVARQFSLSADPSARLLGFFHDARTQPPANCAVPVMGSSKDLIGFARHTPIDQVIVALPWHAAEGIREWLAVLRNIPCDVLLPPPELVDKAPKWGIENIGGLTLLRVAERPLPGTRYLMKAIEDRLLAVALIIVLSPLMGVIAIMIRIDSPGPAIFRQKRNGFNGQIIDVIKFRTMTAQETQLGLAPIVQVAPNDPRVTRIGRWLRRTSLDELPQLFNVLKGDMSLVGPRPHAVSHDQQFETTLEAYISRHRVKPGITGWAQVNGNRGETDTFAKMQQRLEYDLFYIENWTLSLDLRILLRTLSIPFRDLNAY